ncbi:MAG: type II toxin-antitoxin system RelE/ParE family toxin [Nitrospirota bacterium]|nr:type II toxin-antitoxin system RelE/ParE family toxin [Nitrospirota bacterium]
MIEQFGNQLAQDLFNDVHSSTTRRFSAKLRRVARRKLLFLHDAAELKDLRIPPGNRLEALKGVLKGRHSIRINDQWRVVFRWEGGNAFNVQIMDYHK